MQGASWRSCGFPKIAMLASVSVIMELDIQAEDNQCAVQSSRFLLSAATRLAMAETGKCRRWLHLVPNRARSIQQTGNACFCI